MEFSMNGLNTTDKELTAKLRQVVKATKVSNVEELSHPGLMKLTTAALANFVEDLVKVTSKNIDLRKPAAGKFDVLKTTDLKTQRKMIKLQKKQLQSVQTMVKLKSNHGVTFSRNNNYQSSVPSAKAVKKVMKEVVEEDTRSRNLIVYGAHDWLTEDLSPVVDGIFNKI
jgi:hypothetical protein